MKSLSHYLPLVALFTLVSYGQALSQSSGGIVEVNGEVLKPLRLTLADLTKLKTAEVIGTDKEGRDHRYKGVPLVNVLDAAGVTLGAELRGVNLSKYVIVKAADNYEVVFSLPEIDPEFTSQSILLAYEVDGKPLPKGEGPFRMVVPNDKKHARWIREIVSVNVVSSKK